MVRYSREDALTDKEFVQLLEGAREMKEPFDLQARFILMAAGRMGMRGGEIAHISKEWVDKNMHLISIPEHDECNKGKFDEICGYCRNRVKDYLETHNTSLNEEKEKMSQKFGDKLNDSDLDELAKENIKEKNKSYEEVATDWWQPKTTASVRSIPYDLTVRVQLTTEKFFYSYDEMPISKATINRRVNRAAEKSSLNKRIYPHSLRATAATTHASRNVSPYALMSVMGWRDMDTARTYISASDDSAARELRAKHR